MKFVKKIAILIICLFCSLQFAGIAHADLWEFGSSGAGDYPFLPKGYMIVTDSGEYWLSSRFKNTVGGVLYTGTINGLSHVEANKDDGSGYMLYALTDRNPREYTYLAAFKNGVPIGDFSSYIGAPGRVEEEDYMGSNANWKIPIIGFKFEPGALYEFAFLRGLSANNGVTLVLSEDKMGYLRNPETQEEITRYDQEKNKEYEFVTSYWKVDHSDGSYSWDYHLVPMRFSVQTYADLGTWRRSANNAQAFLDSVTPADIANGKYVQSNLVNLTYLLEEQQQEANEFIKLELQNKAEESMAKMVGELEFALKWAMSSEEMLADTSVLEEMLRDARALYDKASGNTGTQVGQYSADRVRELKAVIDHASTLTQTSPQTLIRRAVKDLNDAIIRLLNSQVRIPTMVIHDPVSGVRVLVPKGAVPDNTVLNVNTNSDIEKSERLREYITAEIEDILFYEIRLSGGGGSIQYAEEMEIQIPENDITKDRSVSVYFDGGDPEPVRLSSVRSGGYRVFFNEYTGMYTLIVRAPIGSIAGETNRRDNPLEEETIIITIAEETRIELETEPDRSIEELVEDVGPAEELTEFDFGEEWVRHDVLDAVSFSLEDLRRDSPPILLILLAAALTALALFLLTPEFIANLPRKRSRG